MRIDLGGPALEFVKIHDPQYSARYAAELDGVRVPIRLRRSYTDAGYSGRGTSLDDWHEDMTMLLWDLDDIAGTTPERRGDVLVFTFDDRRHYNAFKAGTITIELRDGVVVIDAAITEQNDSYY